MSSFKEKTPRGAFTLREAARNMLKYLDKYGRKLKDQVPETSLDRYEVAVAKIFEGCETLLAIRFKGEIDPSEEKLQ